MTYSFFMTNYLKKFQDYLQLERNYSSHTVLAYSKDLLFFQSHLAKHFEEDNLLNVNYNQIRSWIIFLSENEISNTSINRKIASLKAFYKYLLKSKQIDVTPLAKHKALKTPKKLQIPFSEKELNQVLNHLTFSDDFEGIRNKLIIDLFYTTGIRRSELINLEIQNFDEYNETIKVLGKRNKERIIPILPNVKDDIVKYIEIRASLTDAKSNKYLFIKINGVKLNDSLVYRIINYYFSNVSEKVKKSPHILRHTFATHMLNNGADLNSVKELLGHSSLASTQIYTHSSLSELKKVYGEAHPRNQK